MKWFLEADLIQVTDSQTVVPLLITAASDRCSMPDAAAQKVQREREVNKERSTVVTTLIKKSDELVAAHQGDALRKLFAERSRFC